MPAEIAPPAFNPFRLALTDSSRQCDDVPQGLWCSLMHALYQLPERQADPTVFELGLFGDLVLLHQSRVLHNVSLRQGLQIQITYLPILLRCTLHHHQATI